LSSDQSACELRTMNLKKLFGKTVFEKFIYLETGADKDKVLNQYKNSDLWWVEDKIENAEEGHRKGLRPIIMEHGHNMHYDKPDFTLVKNWKEIYQLVTCKTK
jgi:hypothetical protein